MSVKFSGSDILEMAIEIEKNGKDYYDGVSNCVKSPKVKNIFKFLGAEEVSHIKIFQKLFETVEKEDIAESYPGEYHEYIEHLSGLHLFTRQGQGKEAACKIKTEKEALNTAIVFEKDSILFYYEFKNFIGDRDQKVINEVIKQEQLHISKLVELIKSL